MRSTRTGRVRKRDRAARGLLAAALATTSLRAAWADAADTDSTRRAAIPDSRETADSTRITPEFLYELRFGMARAGSGVLTVGPTLGPMFSGDERDALGLTLSADLWLVEDGGGFSLSPALRYRHRLSAEAAWSLSAGPVFFPEAGPSVVGRRVEGTVTVGDALLVGARAEQFHDSMLFAPVVGMSGEGAAVVTALGMGAILLLVASASGS